MGDFINFLGNNLADFWTYTGICQRNRRTRRYAPYWPVLYLSGYSQRIRANAADSYRIRYSDR